MEELKFSDFTNKELVGKLVLWTHGMSYSGKDYSIRKIVRATKTQFIIEDVPNRKFDRNSGYQKGLSGRMSIGTISYCKLISEEEANKLRLEWWEAELVRTLTTEIKELIEKNKYSRKVLQEVRNLLNTESK